MLTTVQPMAEAEFRASTRFSCNVQTNPVCQKRVHDASETAADRGVNVGHKVFRLLLSCYVSRKGNTCQVEAKMVSMRLKLIFNSIFVRSQHFFSSR